MTGNAGLTITAELHLSISKENERSVPSSEQLEWWLGTVTVLSISFLYPFISVKFYLWLPYQINATLTQENKPLKAGFTDL